MRIRAITLYQPFATLMVLGLKHCETRGRDTKVRGPLLIHSSKQFSIEYQNLLLFEPFKSRLSGMDLPLGCILGGVDLIDTQPTEVCMKGWRGNELPEEYYFGNYEPNRFAWETRDAFKLNTPIPATGSQGFWYYEFDAVTQTSLSLHLHLSFNGRH